MPQQVAIVIGSGLGGLATAQVLSLTFDSVIVLERDKPEGLLEKTSLDAAKMENRARPGVQQVGSCTAVGTAAASHVSAVPPLTGDSMSVHVARKHREGRHSRHALADVGKYA
jgi:2-polyprenyl-6-methoxyphenol hydroxylase-like FAD-dependent oxidoreductase